MRRDYLEREREDVVASFGAARIIKRDGMYEIRDGNETERQKANEWMTKFLNVTPFTMKRVR